MKETLEGLRHKIEGAKDLGSVIRTMKALSASSISHYERAVQSLSDYYRTVALGLYIFFRQVEAFPVPADTKKETVGTVGAVIFGAGQGLAGQFNDVILDFAINEIIKTPGKKIVWAVGESIQGRLEDAGLFPARMFLMPNSVDAITPLVGDILKEIEAQVEQGEIARVSLYHNRPKSGSIYEPVNQNFLPLDEKWREELIITDWRSGNLPEVTGSTEFTLKALIREYLFVSLFRACAESLASENASRLAAMQRAEKNIEDLLNDLRQEYHYLRQSAIDEELFDVIAGSEAQTGKQTSKCPYYKTGH